MKIDIQQKLSALFEKNFDEAATLILPLAPSGSDRKYYRIKGKTKTVIGTHNPDRKENEAFIHFSKHFKSKDIPVPVVYGEDLDQDIYIQEDLGSTTLYSYLLEKGEGFPNNLIAIYKRVVEELANLQIKGGEGINYDYCYPRKAFDTQSMLWDMHSFKYYFLKLAKIPFDEDLIEKDFHNFAKYLLAADSNYFLFRDFQSRNIMMKNGRPFFIDYQGGRKGALQYDLASLLWQSKAAIPHPIRKELLDHYLTQVEKLIPIDKKEFIEYYYGYVLIRCIQVLGAYGFRGLHERKDHFLSSIPYAIENLKWLLENTQLNVEIPELKKALIAITEAEQFQPFDKSIGQKSLLTVHVNSFSYKEGIPQDNSGHGGGFVFDCRFIHNPGRYQPYKKLTGRDEPVINFLKLHSEMDDFLNQVFHIVDKAVENYLERSFTNLSINFGCTGGQHRSVFSADQVTKHLEKKYGVKVVLHHLVQERKNWVN